MIATTPEKSRHLLELGLDPKTADMYYPYFGAGQYGDTPRVGFPLEYYSGGRDIPAWSLSALLDVMPKELEVELFKTPISGEYVFSFWTNDHHMGDNYKEPIDAAYEMVCWLLRNNLITNN